MKLITAILLAIFHVLAVDDSRADTGPINVTRGGSGGAMGGGPVPPGGGGAHAAPTQPGDCTVLRFF